MVRLNKIYTRTGDDGTTALGTGERRPKYDLRIETFGTVDETNAAIGIARTVLGVAHDTLDPLLSDIQNDLFDLGADLATPDDGKERQFEPLRIIETQVARLENDIDRLNKDLEPLKSFVLPAGSPASAALHLARTIARRAERLMVSLDAHEGETVGEPALKYINRLSDFLFVAGRWANDRGRADVLWVPGQNR